MTPGAGRALEVGRIGQRPRAARRGRGHASRATGPSAPQPGVGALRRRPRARRSTPRARTRAAWLVQFAGVDDRTAAEALLGRGAHRATRSTGDADSTTTSSGCTSSSAREVVDRDGAPVGTGRPRSRRTRRTTCSCSTAARSCPMVFVVEQRDGVRRDRPARRAARPLSEEQVPCASTSSRSSPSTSQGPLDASLLGRARAERSCSTCGCTTSATHTTDRHRSVDDTPFGGGAGMVMTPEPLFAAVEAVEPAASAAPAVGRAGGASTRRTPRELAAGAGFSLLCGRYEGVDQRVADHLCDGELSVGDYVLAGGEAAALVVIDAVARLVPGRHGQRGVGRRRVVRRRAARVPAVHPPGRVPGLRGARGAASAATTPGSPGGGGRRRCAARSTGGPTSSTADAAHRRRAGAAATSSRDGGGSGPVSDHGLPLPDPGAPRR